ncbi:MAG TPA: TRAM domain-containing protein [Thermoanaerobaculia bacterium]|nr:TRAM domain-containing protein [Thermoanaerobaculia bacterium]
MPPAGILLAGVGEAEVEIEKLVIGGEGLARLEGVPLFIRRSAPGDLLRVRITERHPGYGRAEIVEVLRPGPGRRADPFPELARTGACDLQHLDDQVQPLLKAAAVREALERLGKVELPPHLEPVTGEPWGYRLRTQLHVAAGAAAGTSPGPSSGITVGYYARGTHEVVPLPRCPLLVPELEELLPELPLVLGAIGAMGASPPRRIDLAAGDGGAVTAAPVVRGLPQGEVTMTLGGLVYGFDARCFFQVHRGLLPRLIETAVGPWEGDEAFDLYAGVGLFSLALAQRYRRVVAVEADPVAARYARNNARRNRLSGVELVPRVVESWVAQLPSRAARVLVDPPRAGLSSRVRHAFLDLRPQRLTYVSCDAATLARDLRQLDPGFRVESVTLLDLFPQTGHMEAVVQLAARNEVS